MHDNHHMRFRWIGSKNQLGEFSSCDPGRAGIPWVRHRAGYRAFRVC